MKVGSLFSGVGGIEVGFERAGAEVIWNCEIDPRCRSVLAHHWPGLPRFKDVRSVTGDGLRRAGLAPDAIVGGFPCTDVSVAGKRAGLAGEQSGLFFEFARLLDELRPAWALVENVPGLLSSHGGQDMGTVVGHMVDLGYGVAWRVLDAQWFGVAQRRRRVFIVGCLGDRARAAEVLLEPEGGGGDPPARRAAGEESARGVGGCVAGDGDIVTGLTGSFGNGGADDNKAQAGWLIPAVGPLCARMEHNVISNGGVEAGHIIAVDTYNGTAEQDAAAITIRGTRPDHLPHILPVAFHMTQDPITSEDMAPAIGGVKPTTGYSTVAVQQELAVRRLTPLECLRLQGFPDDHLDGLGLADSVKYRMIGNAVAVPVVEWIARRMVKIDEQP